MLRISGGRAGELARMADRPLHALVRGREAPEIKRMAIRSTVRGARSVPRTLEFSGPDPAGVRVRWNEVLGITEYTIRDRLRIEKCTDVFILNVT